MSDLTPEEVTATRDALAAKHGVSDADRDLFMLGSDPDALATLAERLGQMPPPLTAGNVAPKEGTNPEHADYDGSAREFVRDLFNRSDD